MKAFNGFPGWYRNQVGRELSSAIRAGKLKARVSCAMCGLRRRDGAVLHNHLEDYHRMETFVVLCFCCHMAVHHRYGDPRRWGLWLGAIREGRKPPKASGYGTFRHAWSQLPHLDPPVEAPRDRVSWAERLPVRELNLYKP